MTLFWTRYFPNGNFRDSGSYGPIGFDSATRKVLVRLTMNQAGSNIDFILHTHGEIGDNANTQNGFVAGTLVSGSSLGAFTGLIVNAGAGAQVNGMKGCAVGHVLTRAGTNANNIAFGAFETPFSGHRFETAYARMVRVSAEQGVLFSSFGSANSARLGPQPSAPVVGVFQDAADTDMGLLYEPKGALGIEYRTALSLCTGTTAAVATFNLAAGHMTSAFRPVLDDQNTANKIVAKRAIGGESTVSRDVGALSVQPPPLGVGPYEQTRDFNNASHIPYGVDPTSHRDTTADRAGWALNLGTAPDPRFPEFQTIMNTLTPAHRRTVTDIGPGSRVDVTGAERLGVYGTQRQIVRGYSEVITNHVWTVRLVTAPWSPYDASKLEATTHVRLLPSFGATLNTAVNTTVGTLLVTTNAADQWVTTATHPAAFPFGMMIGGEEVTVTAIVGAGTSKTVTVTRSVNGVVKSHAVGAAVTVKSPIKLALS